jgi:hypothetical protein
MRGAGAMVAGHIFQMTAVSAFEDAFLFGALFVLLALVPALFLPAKNIHSAGKPESIAALD